ncbi:hypothetical protein PV360_36940 [Streptomyces scabiei]|nr:MULTISPECIES: hypothetical protein [Streptomyces]MBP5875714.1 hypothetical protein [Streptomyces sp. LBUM 1477]MDX2652172.1 hypothetical protein [Streptomyces scabiei]MDX2725802.1 hypothetical protein [Streptomyces scabiei]MDX2863921.1 hypothetical protein [Streptomyces scabiei]MDX2881845.1 hypothetical protein [Streptomyces scabiei]
MATLHIARRTTPHQPPTALRTWWTALQLRHSHRARTAYFTRLHDALPVDAPDRHALDAPAIEDAFARLAIDHPQAVTPADGGTPAHDADREALLIAVCDRWFREVYPAPDHLWSMDTIDAHIRFLADIRACFNPGGDSA